MHASAAHPPRAANKRAIFGPPVAEEEKRSSISSSSREGSPASDQPKRCQGKRPDGYILCPTRPTGSDPPCWYRTAPSAGVMGPSAWQGPRLRLPRRQSYPLWRCCVHVRVHESGAGAAWTWLSPGLGRRHSSTVIRCPPWRVRLVSIVHFQIGKGLRPSLPRLLMVANDCLPRTPSAKNRGIATIERCFQSPAKQQVGAPAGNETDAALGWIEPILVFPVAGASKRSGMRDRKVARVATGLGHQDRWWLLCPTDTIWKEIVTMFIKGRGHLRDMAVILPHHHHHLLIRSS